MHRRWLILAVLVALGALRVSALDVSYRPAEPTRDDAVFIEISPCRQPGTLHWGVNARGNQWQQAAPEYRPAGSREDGVATRTPMEGPDQRGVCAVALGPFDRTQLVGSVDFAIQWADGTWDTAGGADYHVAITQARIHVEPAQPTLNDRARITVRRGKPGGLLRWGVNAERGMWSPPHSNYWPGGTCPSDDGLAVDSPLPRPDDRGESVITMGPFNRPDQVVDSLHMAVHWPGPKPGAPDDWDTDLGRNYNAVVLRQSGSNGPAIALLSPSQGQVHGDDVMVTVRVDRAAVASLWLNDEPVGFLAGGPFVWPLCLGELPYGPHRLTARTFRGGQVAVDRVEFWRVPPFRRAPPPRGMPLGATVGDDGTVTFALHAPGKHFVSVIGSFNRWDPAAHVMDLAADGTWWRTVRLDPGELCYQYVVDGQKRVADPYARDVEWKNAKGEETHEPSNALSVLEVPARPFGWSDADFRRPPLEDLIIYEFNLEDLCRGQGFTGVIAKLDYIRDLGVTAIEPLPFTEFAGATSWGYNPAFHMAPESTYGTPEELKRLVDEAHRRGLAVIFDMVLNHMDAASPLWQLYGLDYDASPFFRLFLGDNWGFPDLDQESEAFKRYAADVLAMWIREYHADGFRYDATRWTGWQGHHDWGAGWFAYAAKQVDAGTYQIAEHLPSDPELQKQTEMDAGWHDYFRWRLRDMLRNAELNRDEFEKIMDPVRLGFSNALERVAYVESHDEERFLRELREAGYPEREALRRNLAAIAVTLTAPGIPMLYAGQEFGETAPKVVGPNPLRWENLEKPAFRELHDRVRTLVRLRASHPALRSTAIRFVADTPPGVAVYERGSGDSAVLVAVNFGRMEREFTPPGEEWGNVLDPGASADRMIIPPGGAVVLSRQPL